MQVPVADTTLYTEVSGNGPPVLFVHGFPVDGTMWRPTVERLERTWRCIVPDLRGLGRSPASAQVSIARFADDLAELLDVLPAAEPPATGQPSRLRPVSRPTAAPAPVVLVGLSMGGIIAFEFFRRHREKLRALVLCNTRANADTPEGVARRTALAEAVLRDGSRVAADAMIDTVFAPQAPAELKAHWHGVMAAMPPVGVAAASRALAERRESFSTLPTIDCPTLVVAGDADGITPPAGLREIHAQIPRARLAVIAGAGHVPPVEQPDAFAAVLRGFLESL